MKRPKREQPRRSLIGTPYGGSRGRRLDRRAQGRVIRCLSCGEPIEAAGASCGACDGR